ncbi:hypothetical protein [Mesorhizobium sp. M7A.F.Ca.MR.176.00.0.0]|uniref:hypothetical protein n=1 Tax=unclassified Mesorhizobium TaxID=325217 RepID=UPI0019D48D10|nr:hypothetical protein [Mesorhizobium sp. M7A.F.Ca.MR.176.00.0.0]
MVSLKVAAIKDALKALRRLIDRDLGKAWDSPDASIDPRKKVIRLLITEIVVEIVDDTLALVIHWQGGDHTRMMVKKNKIGLRGSRRICRSQRC